MTRALVDVLARLRYMVLLADMQVLRLHIDVCNARWLPWPFGWRAPEGIARALCGFSLLANQPGQPFGGELERVQFTTVAVIDGLPG